MQRMVVIMEVKREIAEVIQTYPVTMAGRTWTIKNVHLERDPDGTVVLPGYEIIRMKRVVANEICGAIAVLSPEEFEFLCDITRTKFNDVAEFLGLTKGSITFWKRPGKSVPLSESLKLKKWFWQKVFSQDVEKHGGELIPMPIVFDDRKLLEFLRERGRKFSDDETLQAS